ncbi:hypothetical protein B0H13DRAFT_2092091 [Mycena leptocephala]|nr:hypothetical protein B0H13DRAFT_2092091 [Mycena leptocephala]
MKLPNLLLILASLAVRSFSEIACIVRIVDITGPTRNDLVALSNFALNSACGWSSNAPLLQRLTTCSYAHLQISFAVLLEEMIRSRLKLLISSIPKWFQIPYALLGKIIIWWVVPNASAIAFRCSAV